MAKPLLISFDLATEGLEKEKLWTAGDSIEWVQTSIKNWPFAYKYRSILQVGELMEEGLFVQLEYKAGTIDDLPERLYFGLHVEGARVFAVDEDGVTGHTNKVGLGRPYYQQRISHPHMHLPVLEASYGYAEPIERVSAEMLWRRFLERANIIGAPSLNLPDTMASDGQLRLI